MQIKKISATAGGRHPTARRKTQPRDADRFLQKLLEHAGAEDALDKLETDGISREVTIAFLRVIAFYRDDDLKGELPHPEDLRGAAARIQRVGDEIAAFNSNPYLDPKRSLVPYPKLQDYARFFALLPGALGAYSGYLQMQAYLMGEIGKTKLSTEKLFIIRLLKYVKQTAGREHYDEVACLLTAAAAVRGSTETIEPGALKVLLQRHRKSITRPRSLQSLPKAIRETIKGLDILQGVDVLQK